MPFTQNRHFKAQHRWHSLRAWVVRYLENLQKYQYSVPRKLMVVWSNEQSNIFQCASLDYNTTASLLCKCPALSHECIVILCRKVLLYRAGLLRKGMGRPILSGGEPIVTEGWNTSCHHTRPAHAQTSSLSRGAVIASQQWESRHAKLQHSE